ARHEQVELPIGVFSVGRNPEEQASRSGKLIERKYQVEFLPIDEPELAAVAARPSPPRPKLQKKPTKTKPTDSTEPPTTELSETLPAKTEPSRTEVTKTEPTMSELATAAELIVK